jgi:hypothetical protein
MTQTNDIEDEKKKIVEPTIETPTPETVDVTQTENGKQVDDTKAKESFKEAMRLMKENESLKSEQLLKDNLIAVAKDTEKLHEIAKSNPEMADAISQEYWGQAYSEVTKKEVEPDTETVAIKTAEEVYDKRERDKEVKKIQDYEIDFFIDQGIKVGDPKFKKVMGTYNKMKPETLDDAKLFLEMTYKQHFPTEEVVTPSPNTSFGGSGAVTPSEFSEEDKEIMKRKNWTPEQMRGFKESALY